MVEVNCVCFWFLVVWALLCWRLAVSGEEAVFGHKQTSLDARRTT